jgi:RNA polymerase sigma factor (TIGR02999 family)
LIYTGPNPGRAYPVSDVTQLLQATAQGDEQAARHLFERVYAHLKQLAHRQLAIDREATLSTTVLVHETYLKLTHAADVGVENRAHFFSLAARAMRQIVIDHARARATEKRGGRLATVALDAADEVASADFAPDQLVRLDAALTQMSGDEPRLAELVEQRFFAGMSIPDIATIRGVSERTLNRDWRRAKAQLYAALNADV